MKNCLVEKTGKNKQTKLKEQQKLMVSSSMWWSMADGVALTWQSEPKLCSAWCSSASFTPCHILWWTEDSQHVQILWETLIFSSVTLNPHRYSFINKQWCIWNEARWSFVCNYASLTKAFLQRGKVLDILSHFSFTPTDLFPVCADCVCQFQFF